MGFPRRQKYNAHPTVWNGKKYPSKAEAARAAELHGRLGADLALVLEQPSVTLVRDLKDPVRYIPDFLVIANDGGWWFEDVKGMKTPSFKIKLKLWRKFGPGVLRLLTRRSKSWYTESVTPGSERDTE